MTAEVVTKALGGRWHGSYGTARCPAHDDREPSLSISAGDKGKVLVRCHAGCEQARVIAALRSCGLWDDGNRRRGRIVRRERRPAVDSPSNRADAKRTVTALRSWEASSPVPGTLAETYLRSRALHHPTSDRIRFHPGLKHPSGGIWPAMVGLVTRGPVPERRQLRRRR